jgi:hypothetical protein
MAQYPAKVQARLALEGALMTRERWMLWMLAGLSAALGIILFVSEAAQKVPS